MRCCGSVAGVSIRSALAHSGEEGTSHDEASCPPWNCRDWQSRLAGLPARDSIVRQQTGTNPAHCRHTSQQRHHLLPGRTRFRVLEAPQGVAAQLTLRHTFPPPTRLATMTSTGQCGWGLKSGSRCLAPVASMSPFVARRKAKQRQEQSRSSRGAQGPVENRELVGSKRCGGHGKTQQTTVIGGQRHAVLVKRTAERGSRF